MKREIRLPLTLLITVIVVVISAGLSSYAKRAPKTTTSPVTTHSFSSLRKPVPQSKSVAAARAAFEKAREKEARNPTKEASLATIAALAAYKEAVDARIAEIGESLS